jgi:hypothetical protein
MYRAQQGMKHIVAVMKRAGEDNPMQVGDIATAEVRRNGILI